MSPESISVQELESALSEIRAHRELPENHKECDLCNWLERFVAANPEIARKILNEVELAGVSYMDALLFLYLGIKLGRRQILEEMVE